MIKTKQERRKSRHKRIQARIFGHTNRPRLVVFRSTKAIYAQLVDDNSGKTIVSAHEGELKQQKDMTKTDRAHEVGKLLAEKATKEKVTTVVFDRNGYAFHGRVKAVAEGAREVGLKF
jgi:large subunit ribosomal protein L18